jgi:hypothetical protein
MSNCVPAAHDHKVSHSLAIGVAEILRLEFWVLELWVTAAAETISGEGGYGSSLPPAGLRVSTDDFVTV